MIAAMTNLVIVITTLVLLVLALEPAYRRRPYVAGPVGGPQDADYRRVTQELQAIAQQDHQGMGTEASSAETGGAEREVPGGGCPQLGRSVAA